MRNSATRPPDFFGVALFKPAVGPDAINKMGSAASTIIEAEAARPADASDLKSDAEARAEVTKN